MLAILNFLKNVNLTDKTICRPGIQLDFEAFSINSCKTSSTRSNKLKLGTFTSTYFDNNSINKKVKQIVSACVSKKCAKICPFLELKPKTWKMFFYALQINNMSLESKNMVLAVPFDIGVNFTDQKFCRLKSQKSGKMPKFLMCHFIPLKDCKTASPVLVKWKLILLVSSS